MSKFIIIVYVFLTAIFVLGNVIEKEKEVLRTEQNVNFNNTVISCKLENIISNEIIKENTIDEYEKVSKEQTDNEVENVIKKEISNESVVKEQTINNVEKNEKEESIKEIKKITKEEPINEYENNVEDQQNSENESQIVIETVTSDKQMEKPKNIEINVPKVENQDKINNITSSTTEQNTTDTNIQKKNGYFYNEAESNFLVSEFKRLTNNNSFEIRISENAKDSNPFWPYKESEIKKQVENISFGYFIVYAEDYYQDDIKQRTLYYITFDS